MYDSLSIINLIVQSVPTTNVPKSTSPNIIINPDIYLVISNKNKQTSRIEIKITMQRNIKLEQINGIENQRMR